MPRIGANEVGLSPPRCTAFGKPNNKEPSYPLFLSSFLNFELGIPIDGSIGSPNDAAEQRKWKLVDSMIKSWIINSISKDFSDTFIYCLTARDLWNTLEERFGASNTPQMYHIQRQTTSLRQGGDSVTVYYNKLHRCWDEMDRVMPMPTSTCRKCNCGLKKMVSNMMASTKLLQFLMGLNPTFDVARTQILNLDPLPTVNKAFSMIVTTDEAQREINMVYSSTSDASSAMLAKTNPGKTKGTNFKRKDLSKKDKYCDHCNANGHTRETCFKIHGFPDWFKELREKKGSKKPIVGMAKEQTASEIGNGQEGEPTSKGDLTTVVNYLLKEVQRLEKGKVTLKLIFHMVLPITIG
ncbi:uncharacterized protein G2W53_007268 [Senna tora]|uniref:Retrotransposon gag domain-containing protein n=1 Tax=Senna tora TaxID=362788 RepID=A0A835CES5_9FABA|nr:uncharacterized protein G2W53_007268 [Senna tora]